MTSNSFATRHRRHKTSFNNAGHKHETSLSSKLWELKEKGKKFDIEWKIIENSKAYKPGEKICKLCSDEKYLILFHSKIDHDGFLNNREEIYSKCRHRDRWKISKVKS